MLEKVDLKRKLEKGTFKTLAPDLRERLGELQRRAKDLDIPVGVVFEGWDGAGKGTLMNELILALDPRGFQVHNVGGPTEDGRFWPPMRRFWKLLPPRGRMALYNRSWYRRVLEDPLEDGAFEEILSFERQLAQDGYLIVKFFLHISKKEQKKRLQALEADPATSWRVTDQDWEHHKRYDRTETLVESMLQRTDKGHAPWTLVEAHDREYATVKILTTVIQALEQQIARVEAARALGAAPTPPLVTRSTPDPLKPAILRSLDLDLSVGQKEYKKQLKELQERLRDIQYELYRVRRPLVVAFEGPDAAGKGGCIKRLTQELDPRGYQVVPTSAPNDWERSHHYLWRFWTAFPKAGHVGIFDRSWYGRVLVERVEGFCSEGEWRRAYGEINEMEEQWVRSGALMVKFWLHISQEEQLRRFEEREKTPCKNWKITPEDWRNREKWPRHEEAAEEMLLRTSTPGAPWVVVEANCKEYARLKVLRKVVETAEGGLGKK